MRFFLVLITIFLFTQCTTSHKVTASRCNIEKMLTFFVSENKIENKENLILLIEFNNFPQKEKNYLVTFTAFDKNKFLGKNDDLEYHGFYNQDGYNITIVGKKNIPLEKVSSCFSKTSQEFFYNENGEIDNYDPETMKFYVDKNFKYVQSFYNTKDEIVKSKKIKKYLQSAN